MKNKRNLFIIAWLVLILIGTSYGQSKAAELPQEEPPAQGVPTQVPTLPVELSIHRHAGLDGGIRHVVLEGSSYITSSSCMA